VLLLRLLLFSITSSMIWRSPVSTTKRDDQQPAALSAESEHSLSLSSSFTWTKARGGTSEITIKEQHAGAVMCYDRGSKMHGADDALPNRMLFLCTPLGAGARTDSTWSRHSIASD
jgi:hypothetical protein